MKLDQLLLGQIPEAIYFALFMIFTKQLREKRILFASIIIIEYVLLFNVFKESYISHIIFFISMYCLLKIFYKEKCQITDIFALGIASIILMITSAILYLIVWKTVNVFMVYVILHRIVLFLILILFKDKLPKIQSLYKKLWNRNDNVPKKIKSTTFRSLNLVAFNLMFYIINLGILYMLFTRR
jgi:hypothetical protein